MIGEDRFSVWIDRARTSTMPALRTPDILRRGSKVGLVQTNTRVVASRLGQGGDVVGNAQAQRARLAVGSARGALGTPLGRGFALVTIAAAATGFAMAAQQNIVSNYFEHELGLKGPQFGYITAIREIPGFLLIF